MLSEKILHLPMKRQTRDYPLMPHLGKLVAAVILKELRHPSKAESKMVSSIAGEFAYHATSEEDNLHGTHC